MEIPVLTLLEGYFLSGDSDSPPTRQFQKVDAAQKRALARTGSANLRHDIAFMRDKRHALEDFKRAEILVEVVDLHRNLL
jgi:hypothetical protein